MDRSNGKFNKDLATEADKKLAQLNFLLKEIIELDKKSREFTEYISKNFQKAFDKEIEWDRDKLKEVHLVDQKIEILTYSFYYFAHRCQHILQHLPALGDFDPMGVELVRNDLIEHSESSDDAITINSFGYGADRGPVVKAVRNSNQANLKNDPGLYVNAKEFINELKKLLLKQVWNEPDLIKK